MLGGREVGSAARRSENEQGTGGTKYFSRGRWQGAVVGVFLRGEIGLAEFFGAVGVGRAVGAEVGARGAVLGKGGSLRCVPASLQRKRPMMQGRATASAIQRAVLAEEQVVRRAFAQRGAHDGKKRRGDESAERVVVGLRDGARGFFRRHGEAPAIDGGREFAVAADELAIPDLEIGPPRPSTHGLSAADCACASTRRRTSASCAASNTSTKVWFCGPYQKNETHGSARVAVWPRMRKMNVPCRGKMPCAAGG